MTDEEPDPGLLGVQRPKAYEGLFERLVGLLGLSLNRCRKEHGLGHQTIERMMSRCAACAESEQCHRYLSQADGRVIEPPEYCSNRKMLLSLKSKTETQREPGGEGD